MNLVENKTLRSQLRDDEAAVVENAVRLAIESVLNVLYGVTGARTREYQRVVAARDQEVRRLEGRLAEIERELQVLRRHGCACALFEARMSGSGLGEEQVRSEPAGLDPEEPAGPLVYARPSTRFPSLYHESILSSPPSCLGMNSTCSSEASALTEASRNAPTSPSRLAVKEEPCDVDAVLIEWELSEEGAAGALERAGAPSPDEQSPNVKQSSPENNESRTPTEETPVNPPDFQLSDGDQLKSKKKNVPTSQLTEEAQRLRRAAWRAASKRYYARKIARQQARLQHAAAAHTAHPPRGGFTHGRRNALISDLPEDEAWSAASRRYYSRRTEGLQNGLLMENFDPAGAAQGPNGEGPLVISGRIMCS